ncbi:hypothetical protein DOE76_17785 [Leifsonia sp. ku-ls]|nr:hypothetical protein DOE76_17785 [Leifsonia sp. ku-ls]
MPPRSSGVAGCSRCHSPSVYRSAARSAADRGAPPRRPRRPGVPDPLAGSPGPGVPGPGAPGPDAGAPGPGVPGPVAPGPLGTLTVPPACSPPARRAGRAGPRPRVREGRAPSHRWRRRP